MIAPNDVDVDSAGRSHEEQPLEKVRLPSHQLTWTASTSKATSRPDMQCWLTCPQELAAQVALRAALLSAADSSTATEMQLPAYTKV